VRPRRQTGSTLLELAVVGIIIGILAMILLNRLLRYQEVAEKTVMETTVINMRSGLRLHIAELMIQNKMNEMGKLARENPILWLEAPPPNYIGQLDHPGQHAIPPGSWYFDEERQELVYVPDRDKYLKPGPDGIKAIRFHVTAMTWQGEKGATPVVEGVTINPVVPYDWPVF
jgi:competence protein ComGC